MRERIRTYQREYRMRKRRAAGIQPRPPARTLEERRAVDRERARKRRLDPAYRQKEDEKRVERYFAQRSATAERRKSAKAAKALARAERAEASRKSRDTKRKIKAAPRRAPREVREAWKRSHPNSIIRKKFPTLQSLDKNYEEAK